MLRAAEEAELRLPLMRYPLTRSPFGIADTKRWVAAPAGACNGQGWGRYGLRRQRSISAGTGQDFQSSLPDTPNGKCSLLLAIAMTIEG